VRPEDEIINDDVYGKKNPQAVRAIFKLGTKVR
jgi:hypothetical protein